MASSVAGASQYSSQAVPGVTAPPRCSVHIGCRPVPHAATCNAMLQPFTTPRAVVHNDLHPPARRVSPRRSPHAAGPHAVPCSDMLAT